MDIKPDTITITASQREEVPATHADLFVTVKGSSLVSGDSALKKAKEVNQLVQELVKSGFPADDIHLQSIHAENTSGPILKTSNATYRLRLRCNKLEQIPDLLGIITSQKNGSFERLAWKYSDDEAREIGLEKAILKANKRAEMVAAALGVKLLGVYSLSETLKDEESPYPMPVSAAQARPRAVGVVPQTPDIGTDIQHNKSVRYVVEIEYRVSSFDQK